MLPKRNNAHSRKQGKKIQFIILFSVILLIIIAGGIYRIREELAKSIWDREERISLIWIGNPLFLTSYDPSGNKLIVLTFPDNVYTNVPGGYGEYKLSNIWKLSQMERKNGTLLTKSVSNMMGIPVQGWVAYPSKDWQIFNDDFNKDDFKTLGNEFKNLRVIGDLLGKTEGQRNTNLSYFDTLSLWNAIRSLRLDDVTYLKMEDLKATDLVKLPDGMTKNIVDQKLFDDRVGDLFYEKHYKNESLAIAIKNATTEAGLGGQVARFINNQGGHVIQIDNQSNLQKKSTCLLKDSNVKWLTIKGIKELTGCTLEYGETKDADIIIIIGEEAVSRFR